MSTAVSVDPCRVIADAGRRVSSGILCGIRGKLRRLICIREGQVVFVASNVIEEQPEEYLVGAGLLSEAELSGPRNQARATGRNLASVLVEEGLVRPDVLYGIARDRVRELVFSTLDWPDGSFEFNGGRPDLEGRLTVELPCLPLLLDYAVEHPKSLNEVRARTGPPNMRPKRVENADELLSGLELDERNREVLEQCGGSLSAAEIVARTGIPSERVLRAVYGLVLVGVVEAATEDMKTGQRDAQDRVTRDEVLARLRHVNEPSPYMVLGLPKEAEAEEIREAYYYLARRYHPDRFRVGDLADLLDQIEQYFTKVTEAYNTLYDPEARKRYDEELSERASVKPSETTQDTAYLARQNYARGKLLTDRKQFQESVQFFENALKLDPSRAIYHMELGSVLTRNPRRRDEAESLLKTAIQMNPALVQSYLALGELYVKTGRVEEAAESYDEALRWEPSNDEVQARLAALGGSKGRRKGLFGG